MQAMTGWLHMPRGDGHPKVLECDFSPTELEGLIRAFATATGPVNFVVTFCNCSDGIVPFKLANVLTGERFKFRRLDVDKWRLVRCPSERDEAEWAVWEAEAAGTFDAHEGPENE
uniref:Uncharacterized protein n=1 Tax=Globodera rostochiensis TaxID=31243 RepID=A0A914H305_GLORO